MTKLPVVAEYMVTRLHTLRPEQNIGEAIDFLLSHEISGAPVIDSKRNLVGVLSEKDCLRILAKGSNHLPASGTVGDFMTRDVHTIPPHLDIYYAAGLFLANPYRRFPVVKEGVLVGQVSRRDILKAVQEIAFTVNA